MANEEHVLLLIEHRQGKPLREPVHAERVGDRKYRLLYSPGLVQGIAAGDEFTLLSEDGTFEVARRSSNIAVQVFSKETIEPIKTMLTERVQKLGGVLDGCIDRGLVFTIPLQAGFQAIESVFNGAVMEHPELEWYYGNVYDPRDGHTPLNWWQ
jgi:hypothetical protein